MTPAAGKKPNKENTKKFFQRALLAAGAPNIADPLGGLQWQQMGALNASSNLTSSPLTTANVKYGTTGSTSSYTGTQVMQSR